MSKSLSIIRVLTISTKVHIILMIATVLTINQTCFSKVKKSSFVSGNWPGEIFLSLTRPHKPNVYEDIYFLFQKKTHTNKKISTSKFIRTNLRFVPFKQ